MYLYSNKYTVSHSYWNFALFPSLVQVNHLQLLVLVVNVYVVLDHHQICYYLLINHQVVLLKEYNQHVLKRLQ